LILAKGNPAMPSPAAIQIREFLLARRDAPPPATVEEARANLEAMASLAPLPPDLQVEAVVADGVPGEWLTPPGVSGDRVILHLHGGGYVMGSCNTERDLAARLGAASDARVLSIEYRLAPEHPFPAALEDATEAYRWLLGEGVPPECLAITGASAGGGLAAATLLSLRDAGDPLPAAAALISPWADLLWTGDSMVTRAEEDPWLSPQGAKEGARFYLGGADGRLPLASPVYGEMHGLPPLLIHAGDDEILLDDSTRLAELARAAGVEVTLDVWEGMWHAWHAFAFMLPEGQEAIEDIGQFIRERTGGHAVAT
jgi:monoterpene epsilon-lactone hydrolase